MKKDEIDIEIDDYIGLRIREWRLSGTPDEDQLAGFGVSVSASSKI